MEIDLKLCNFAAEKASLLGACPQQGVGMKVKNKPWHSLNYTPLTLLQSMLPRVTNFNSIKVQLEPEFGLYKSQIDDFNSIKVQF